MRASVPDRRALAGWSLLVVAGAACLALLARGVPNLFFEDDAYFYLQIAWNMGTGRGSTFDGLHVTNGYHLLWAGLLTPLAALTATLGLGKPAFLAVVCVIAFSIAAASAATAFRTAPERALALLVFLFCGITMETLLLGGLLLLVARMFLGELALRRSAVALVAAAIPVTRIDFLWVAPALAVLAASDGDRTRDLPIGPVLAGTALGMAVHFACEQAFFGTWTSVSSAYKADAARGGAIWHLIGNLRGAGNQLRYAATLCLATLASVGWARRRAWQDLGALAVALAPIGGYTFLTDMRDWYFLTGLLLSLLFASRATADRPRIFQLCVTAISVLLISASSVYLVMNAADWRRTSRFVERANDVLTPDDVVYQVDGAGFTGWWLHAHIVDGDGLVNSWDYRRQVLSEHLGGYLDEIAATHVLTDTAVIFDPLISSRHGMIVRRKDTRLVLDTGATRNALVQFRLFSLVRHRESGR